MTSSENVFRFTLRGALGVDPCACVLPKGYTTFLRMILPIHICSAGVGQWHCTTVHRGYESWA